MLELEVKNKKIKISRFKNSVSIQGNNDTDLIVFIIDKVQGIINLEKYKCVIKARNEKGVIDAIYPEMVIDDHLIYLKWKITKNTTAMSGITDIQIEFYDISDIDNVPVWQSDIAKINIQKAINLNDVINQDVSAFYEWEKRLNDIKDQVYLRLDETDDEHKEILSRFQEVSDMIEKLREFYEDIFPHLTGDANTLQGRIIDDTKKGQDYLWTSEKIAQEDEKLSSKILSQVSTNALSLQGRTVDDSKEGNSYLWTSTKVSQEISKRIATLNASVVYCVSTTGADTNSGTSTSPFRTIAKALSKIPKNLNGYNATINIANGTYSENINTSGFFGLGRLSIIGNTTNPQSVKVQCGRLSQINTILVIDGIEFTSNIDNIYLYVAGCSKGFVKNCYFNGINKSNNFVGVLVRGSNVSIYNSEFLNFHTAILNQSGVSAIGVDYFSLSYIVVDSCRGSGNTYGMRAVGGIITDAANNIIMASLRHITESGGLIVKGVGGFIG